MKSMLLCSLALAGMVGIGSDASAAIVVRAGRVRVAVGRPVHVPPRIAPRPLVYRVPAPRPVAVPVPAPVAVPVPTPVVVPSAAARETARILRNQRVRSTINNAVENAVENAVNAELEEALEEVASANQ